MDTWKWKTVVASLLSICAAMLGGWDTLAQAMIAAIALDVVAGVLRAGYEKRLNSSVMRKGVFRKAGYFVAVLLAVLLDRALFHQSPIARTLVISYVIVNESLSIIEHLAAMRVPLPAELKATLEKLRHREQGNDGQG